MIIQRIHQGRPVSLVSMFSNNNHNPEVPEIFRLKFLFTKGKYELTLILCKIYQFSFERIKALWVFNFSADRLDPLGPGGGINCTYAFKYRSVIHILVFISWCRNFDTIEKDDLADKFMR